MPSAKAEKIERVEGRDGRRERTGGMEIERKGGRARGSRETDVEAIA